MILTLNEQTNIEACLDSLSWCDDIVVLDSISSDRTVELAQARGARVVARKFDNWATHQNWAVNNIEFRYPWVFYLDADERCDPELAQEIQKITSSDHDSVAYRIRRKDYFMGKWLKRAQHYPTWIIRLFRPDKIRYERLVNPVAVVSGKTGNLSGHILHYPFSHGITHWINRHNNYSDMEAIELIKGRKHAPVNWSACLAADPNERRMAIKNIYYRLPARPLLKFMYLYLFRRGFLDGKAGFTYCCLLFIYEFMITIKADEIRRKTAGFPL